MENKNFEESMVENNTEKKESGEEVLCEDTAVTNCERTHKQEVGMLQKLANNTNPMVVGVSITVVPVLILAFILSENIFAAVFVGAVALLAIIALYAFSPKGSNNETQGVWIETTHNETVDSGSDHNEGNYENAITDLSETSNNQPKTYACAKCGGTHIKYETVTEQKKTGCGKIFLYIVLAVSILGWLVLIPLLLRSKTETVTYAVCQNCGNRWRTA